MASQWIGSLFGAVALTLMVVMAWNPRLAARLLSWDRYLASELLRKPHFYPMIRIIGVAGLVLLLMTLFVDGVWNTAD